MSKDSIRERLLKQREELKRRNSTSSFYFIKEGTTRMRVRPGVDDKYALAMEVTQFYLGANGINTIYSPSTLGEPCPFMEKFQELKNSKDPDDKELAKKLIPRKRFLIGASIYKEGSNKEIDPDRKEVGVIVSQSIYQEIVELYLDEEDYGDMTDPDEGYDIKITREGKGKNDTTYACRACSKSRAPKEATAPIDLEELLRKELKSYEELEDILNQFLSGTSGDEDGEDSPKKRSDGDISSVSSEDDEEKPKKKIIKKKVIKESLDPQGYSDLPF